jgi:hypothetical protein
VRNTYRRTHRWEKVLRDQDQLELIGKEASLVNVLFSTIPEDLDLYGKPMARNVQMWTRDAELLLDGPHATPADIKRAMQAVQAGGMFGYRFLFPAMRVGKHEVSGIARWWRIATRPARSPCCPTHRSAT